MNVQNAGNRKFKVNVSGGHVLCGDNSRMDVTYRTDQLISSIPYTVYSQLSALLIRDRIDLAAKLFNLTLEEAISLKDNTDHECHGMDAIFQLMKERNVNLGHLVEVLREMQRYDALSVLIKAGYPDHPDLHPSFSEEESSEEVLTLLQRGSSHVNP